MGEIFYRIAKLYYNLCNPYNQDYFERKKQDDDFKLKNHQEILKLVEEHPLDVLRNMSADEIDQLAYKFSILLKGSYYVYPATSENDEEIDMVRERISRSDYTLAKRFRTSFQKYVRDLYYKKTRDLRALDSYVMLVQIYDDKFRN